jgi:excisionase family DNA binding protein
MDQENISNSDIVRLDKLLTPREVSEILRTSRSFTYRLLQVGSIPVVRLGKSCRVRPKDLAQFIENNLHRQVDNP